MNRQRQGFSLIELLIVIAVIGTLATVVAVATAPARSRARDVKRQFELAQVGRFLAGGGCYQPNAGPGDYDLAQLFGEFKTKFPQYAQLMSRAPRDPKGGTDAVTKYRYVLSEDGRKCALYANLENDAAETTLKAIAAPTPGGGSGVFGAATDGPNGSGKYFQVSN